MKRVLPIILTLMLLLAACGKEPVETSPGPQESVSATDAVDSGGEGEGILEEKDTETVYLLVRQTSVDRTGAELWHREYLYDDRGFCTEEREVSNIGTAYGCVHMADGQGRVASSTFTEPDGSQYTLEYTYDGENRVILEQRYQEGQLTEYTEYTYNDRGDYLTMKQYYGDQMVMDYSFAYIYDDGGRLLTRDEYLFGELLHRVEFAYDASGREISSTVTMIDGTVQSRTESTWEGLTETRSYYSYSDQPDIVSVITYDEAGNILFQENRQGDMTISVTEYVYEPYEVKK